MNKSDLYNRAIGWGLLLAKETGVDSEGFKQRWAIYHYESRRGTPIERFSTLKEVEIFLDEVDRSNGLFA